MRNRVRLISGRSVAVAVIAIQAVVIVMMMVVIHAYQNVGWTSESEVLNRLSAVEAEQAKMDNVLHTAINLSVTGITALNQHINGKAQRHADKEAHK